MTDRTGRGGGRRAAAGAPTLLVGRGEAGRPSPVDYTLFARRRIGEALDDYASRPLTHPETRRAIRRLGLMGPEVLAIALERLGKERAGAAIDDGPARARRIGFLALVLQELGDAELIPSLLELLHDGDVADDVKAALIGPLTEFGYDVEDLNWAEIYHDPESVQRRFQRGFLDMLDEVGEAGLADALDDVLEEAQPPPIFEAEARSLAQSGDDRAARVLQLLLRQPEANVQLAAVHGLAAINGPRALHVLRAFAGGRGAWPIAARVRREAARHAELMRQRGIRAQPCPDPAQIGALTAIEASSIDSEGTRSLWVVRRLPVARNALVVTIYLLNTVSGLVGIFGRHSVGRAALAELRREARARMRLVPVDAGYAGQLFRDALWLTLMSGGRPPRSFAFWQDYLPADWLDAQPYRLEPIGAGAATPRRGARRGGARLASWPELFETVDFRSWVWEDPLVYEAVDRVRAGARLRDAQEQLCAALLPGRLLELRRRLDLTGDLLMRAGMARSGQAARRASAELAGPDPCRHPFSRSLVRRSLALARRNAAAGLDPRINPAAFQA